MDPDATWTMVLQAYRDAEWPQVLELSDALRSWLDRGGFPPPGLKQTLGVDDAAAKVVTLAFCRYAHERARGEGSDAP